MKPRVFTEPKVLNALRHIGRGDLAALSAAVGCSQNSARMVVADLVVKGDVVAETHPAGPGRPRVIYRPKTEADVIPLGELDDRARDADPRL